MITSSFPRQKYTLYYSLAESSGTYRTVAFYTCNKANDLNKCQINCKDADQLGKSFFIQ